MRQPISWHQKNQVARRSSLHRMKEEINRKQADYDRLASDIEFQEYQIQTAIKENKDSFDPETYCTRRKK